MAETSYQSTSPYFKDDVETLIKKGWEYTDEPYKGYTGDRVAGLTDEHDQAFDISRHFAGSDLYAPEAADAYRSYGGAPAQAISFRSLVDETGPLGAMADYMNPYLDAVLAPQLREIERQGAMQRLDLNALATGAGAFGDARHGVMESEQQRNQSQLMTDTAGRAHADAFNAAMGMRANDMARLFETDQFNANAVERGLDRVLGGGKALEQLGETERANMLSQIQALISSGDIMRRSEQAGLDVDYDEYLRRQDEPLKDINTMLSILSGSSSQTPVTTTTTTPTPPEPEDNSIFGLIGGLFDSIF